MLSQFEREPSGSHQDVLSRWYETFAIQPDQLWRFVPEKIIELSSQNLPHREGNPKALREIFEAYFFGEQYHTVGHLRLILKKLGYLTEGGNITLDAYLNTLDDKAVLPEEIFSEAEAERIKTAPFLADESYLDVYRGHPSISAFVHELVIHSRSERLGESFTASFEDGLRNNKRFIQEISDQLPQIILLPGVGYRFAVPVPPCLRFRGDRQIHQIAGEDLLVVADVAVHKQLLERVQNDQVLLSFFLKFSAAAEQFRRFEHSTSIVDEAILRRKEQFNKHYGMLTSRLCAHFISLLKKEPTKVLVVYRGFEADTQKHEDDIVYRKLPYVYEYQSSKHPLTNELVIQARVNQTVQQGRASVDSAALPLAMEEQFLVSTSVNKNEPVGWDKKAREHQVQHYPYKYVLQYTPYTSPETRSKKVALTFEHIAETEANHLLYSLLRPIAAVVDRKKLHDLGPAYEMQLLGVIDEIERTTSVAEFLKAVRHIHKQRSILHSTDSEPELIAVPAQFGLTVTTTPHFPSKEEVANN